MKPFLALVAFLSLALSCLSVDVPSYPQATLAGTQLRVLPKASNGRAYQLHIYLPPSYATHPEKHYPVLYQCDAQYDFPLVVGELGNLRYDRHVPEFIIIGIGYPETYDDYNFIRFHDYFAVPDTEKDPAKTTAGHGPEFLTVLEKEIMPYAEKEFRIDPAHRILSGSSASGHFALFALFTRPELFEGVIAISPAVNHARNWLFGLEDRFHAAGGSLAGKYAYLTGAGEEGAAYLAEIVRFNEVLRARRYPDFHYGWRLIDGEAHTTCKPEAYNRGLHFVFGRLVGK